MSLLKKREVIPLNPPQVLLSALPNLIAAHAHCIILCYSRDNFILLGLVINNGDFLFLPISELPSE